MVQDAWQVLSQDFGQVAMHQEHLTHNLPAMDNAIRQGEGWWEESNAGRRIEEVAGAAVATDFAVIGEDLEHLFDCVAEQIEGALLAWGVFDKSMKILAGLPLPQEEKEEHIRVAGPIEMAALKEVHALLGPEGLTAALAHVAESGHIEVSPVVGAAAGKVQDIHEGPLSEAARCGSEEAAKAMTAGFGIAESIDAHLRETHALLDRASNDAATIMGEAVSSATAAAVSFGNASKAAAAEVSEVVEAAAAAAAHGIAAGPQGKMGVSGILPDGSSTFGQVQLQDRNRAEVAQAKATRLMSNAAMAISGAQATFATTAGKVIRGYKTPGWMTDFAVMTRGALGLDDDLRKAGFACGILSRKMPHAHRDMKKGAMYAGDSINVGFEVEELKHMMCTLLQYQVPSPILHAEAANAMLGLALCSKKYLKLVMEWKGTKLRSVAARAAGETLDTMTLEESEAEKEARELSSALANATKQLKSMKCNRYGHLEPGGVAVDDHGHAHVDADFHVDAHH